MKESAERVPVAPLREAFLRSGMSAKGLAVRLGWTRVGRLNGSSHRKGVIGDATRVRTALGLKQCVKRRGVKVYRSTQTTVPYDTALAICRALDADPIDVGL